MDKTGQYLEKTGDGWIKGFNIKKVNGSTCSVHGLISGFIVQ
jgi:hypothetical protein